ncbi:SPOR domain-containing protein [Chitinimonas koreensis]|uniref:SPOR domain-containing protein n=1 Tax=Chitinimonas koreensis TaxID=356302 RepID=UPI00165411C6|nr:SPOR domain-containing protein [Chitinimonas koreensis]QNM96368.1 SPOR domain-containing protein [Chitinimonas koreensis]
MQLGGEIKLENNEPEGPTRYWVLIPPRSTSAEAQRKAEELKAIGVVDFFVVSDDKKWLNAISLGLFSTREAAERRLDALKQQGVRTATLRERREGAPASSTFYLRNVAREAKSALSQAASAFRGSTVGETPC